MCWLTVDFGQPFDVEFWRLVPGKHVINMFVQYTPFHLASGNWEDQDIRVSQLCKGLPNAVYEIWTTVAEK